MNQLILLIMLAKTGGSNLNVKDLLGASEARLKVVVGPRTSPKREPGIRFAHPGFYEVWVDSDGIGMHHLRMSLGKLLTWNEYLRELGLDPSKASARQIATAPSSVPLFRNKLALSGVRGVPMTQARKPWSITFVEYAVANKARLRALKPQIRAQPVGEGRESLIRSCYDWWSELDFTSP